jgi:hypothetical protein
MYCRGYVCVRTKRRCSFRSIVRNSCAWSGRSAALGISAAQNPSEYFLELADASGTAETANSTFRIDFANTGKAGVCFHVPQNKKPRDAGLFVVCASRSE